MAAATQYCCSNQAIQYIVLHSQVAIMYINVRMDMLMKPSSHTTGGKKATLSSYTIVRATPTIVVITSTKPSITLTLFYLLTMAT